MFECSICMLKLNLGENTTIAATSCRDASHLFHRDCIEQWLRTNNTCPTCRSNITVESLKRFSPDLNKDLAYSGWSKKTVDALEKVESNDEDTKKVILERIKELEGETRALAKKNSALESEKNSMKKNLNVAKTLAGAFINEAKRWQEKHDKLQAANDESRDEGQQKKKRRKLSKNAGKEGDGVSEKILIAGGMRGAWSSDQSSLNNKSKNVMSYDLNSGKWEACAELKTTGSDHQTVEIGGKLVTVLTYHGIKKLHDIDVVLLTQNPTQLEVQQVQTSAEMSRKRYGFAVCSFHDCILVSGGCVFDDAHIRCNHTQSCELFTFKSNRWMEVTSLNLYRSHHAMVYFGGKAWAIGGYCMSKSEATDSIELFDPVANKWEVSEVRMVQKRQDHGAVVYGRKIFVVSGIDENDERLDTVEVFSSNQFTLITPKLKLGRTNFGMCVYKKYLLVCGGIVNDPEHQRRNTLQGRHTDEVECLNLETLKFRKFPGLFKKLPFELINFGMCCISY